MYVYIVPSGCPYKNSIKSSHDYLQEGFSRPPRGTLLYSCPHSVRCCRGWRPWFGFRNRKGNHSWFSAVRSVQAARASSEVVVPKADSLVGAAVSVDRLDRLLHKHHY